MIVSSGKFKGRRLADNHYAHIRPTADIVKQAIFNKLTDEVQGAKVLDLFCGTGALGIEAISRGAKEVVFADRKDFCIDSLAYIPFSSKEKVIMETVLSETQGVKLPLFEARMPYKHLLKGLDEQLIVNEISKRKDLELYAGLKVGDVEKANNNAGNWE